MRFHLVGFLSRKHFGEKPLSQSMSSASLPVPSLIALLEVLIDGTSCALTIMALNQINNLRDYILEQIWEQMREGK